MNRTLRSLAAPTPRADALTPQARARACLSLFAALLIGTGIAACTSLDPGTTAVRLHGMVSSENGLPISDAEVSLTDVEPVQTDIRGRFVVENVPIGRGLATVRHPDYRDVETEIGVTGPADVIHVRLQSLRAVRDHIVESAVAAIVRSDFAEAHAILASFEDDEPDPRLSLLDAVVLWRLGRTAEAHLAIARLDRFPGTAAVVATLRSTIEEGLE